MEADAAGEQLMQPAQLTVSFASAGSAEARREGIEAMHATMPDFWNLAVQKKLGLPPAWQWFSLKVVGVDTLVTGAVPLRFTRTGRPVWPKVSESQVCVITDAERQAAREEWTRTTGRCYQCAGSGEEFWKWDHITGKQYRPCRRCTIHTPTAQD